MQAVREFLIESVIYLLHKMGVSIRLREEFHRNEKSQDILRPIFIAFGILWDAELLMQGETPDRGRLFLIFYVAVDTLPMCTFVAEYSKIVHQRLEISRAQVESGSDFLLLIFLHARVEGVDLPKGHDLG